MFLGDAILVHRSFPRRNRRRNKWYQKRNGQCLRLFSPPNQKPYSTVSYVKRGLGVTLTTLSHRSEASTSVDIVGFSFPYSIQGSQTHQLNFPCATAVLLISLVDKTRCAEVESERHTFLKALHIALYERMDAHQLHLQIRFMVCAP